MGDDLRKREESLDQRETELTAAERALDGLWDTWEKRLKVLVELQDYLGEREDQLRERAERMGVEPAVLDQLLVEMPQVNPGDRETLIEERSALLNAREELATRRAKATDERREALATAAATHATLEQALLEREKQLATAFRRLVEHASGIAPPEPDPDEENRRRFTRIEVCAHVGVGTPHRFFEGRAANMSVGGVFLATRNLLHPGREVDLVLSLPEAGRVELKGEVSWRRGPGDDEGPPGFGVAFTEADETARSAIEAFVDSRT